MVKIKNYFFNLQSQPLITIALHQGQYPRNCTRCNTLGIAPDLNPRLIIKSNAT